MQTLLVRWYACSVWLEKWYIRTVLKYDPPTTRGNSSGIKQLTSILSLLCSVQWRGSFIFKKRKDVKYGRTLLSCEELAADTRPTTRIMKKVGEGWERRIKKDKWERSRQEDAVFGCHIWLWYEKNRNTPPLCMWTRKKRAASLTGLRTRVL